MQGQCHICGTTLMSASDICLACFSAHSEMCTSCMFRDSKGIEHNRRVIIHTDADGKCTVCGGAQMLLEGKKLRGY